ncbi:MAG: hypothetical protein KIH08_11615 [Candidatus Freyarchaeota archaeon]|nr:hypothetical protein [Candidatus Jordarchaeia archaeon]
MPSERIRLTANFKLADGNPPEVSCLMDKYSEMVNELLEYAQSKGITSFKRLKAEKCHELRAENPELPSHYIYTACQMASWTYKSFRKLKRRGKAHGDRPLFKKGVVMLDDHLFTLNLEKWEASIATSKGRISVKLMHGTYHEKFKGDEGRLSLAHPEPKR